MKHTIAHVIRQAVLGAVLPCALLTGCPTDPDPTPTPVSIPDVPDVSDALDAEAGAFDPPEVGASERDVQPDVGCAVDADCRQPETTPPGCAEAVCDVARRECVVRARDADGDSFRAANCRTLDGATVASGGDCDDARSEVNPDAMESCNGRDDNCNREVDEGIAPSATRCQRGAGECLRSGYATCVDGRWDGCSVEAAEPAAPTDMPACDGRDYNCDGMPLTGCACRSGDVQPCPGAPSCVPAAMNVRRCEAGRWSACPSPVARVTFCANGDGDPAVVCRTECPDFSAGGWARNDNPPSARDCDDGNPRRYPGNAEVCDGVDNDCNAGTGEPAQTCSACGGSRVTCGQGNTCGSRCPPGMADVGGGRCRATATRGYYVFGQSERGPMRLGAVPNVPGDAAGASARVEIDFGIPVPCGTDGGGGCCQGGNGVVARLYCFGGDGEHDGVDIRAGQFGTSRATAAITGCRPGDEVYLDRRDNLWTACAHFTCCGCGCARRFYETRMYAFANRCGPPA